MHCLDTTLGFVNRHQLPTGIAPTGYQPAVVLRTRAILPGKKIGYQEGPGVVPAQCTLVTVLVVFALRQR